MSDVDLERRAVEEWRAKYFAPGRTRKPRPPAHGDRYPGQVLNHTCGIGRRTNCVACATERSFKRAVVTRVAKIPRSPHRMYHFEYEDERDQEMYFEDEVDGYALRVKGRIGVAVGDVVLLRWHKKPRAKRWRLEIKTT